MAQAKLTRVLEDIATLEPDELQQVIQAARSRLASEENGQEPSSASPDAWSVLEEMIGTVSAPLDWAEEHDHYLSSSPKRRPETKP